MDLNLPLKAKEIETLLLQKEKSLLLDRDNLILRREIKQLRKSLLSLYDIIAKTNKEPA